MFVRLTGKFHLAGTSNFAADSGQPVFAGMGNEIGGDGALSLLVYYLNNYGWVMTGSAQYHCFEVKMGDVSLSVFPSYVNGAIAFRQYGTSVLRGLYWSRGWSRWIYMEQAPFMGYEPQFEYNDATEKYEGDAFYLGRSLPDSEGRTVVFEPWGTLLNGDAEGNARPSITAAFYFPRWQRSGSAYSSPYGEYAPMGGAEGSRVLGCPRWRDQNGVYYVRSLEKDASWSRYSYGGIVYVGWANAWIIGSYGSASGWWQGAEPSKDTPVVFVFTMPEGEEVPEGRDLTVSFADYVAGENRVAMWAADAAVARG